MVNILAYSGLMEDKDNPTTIVLTHNGPPPPQGADSLLSGFGVSSIRFNKQ